MDNRAPVDLIGRLIADVDASGVERAQIAADAGMSLSQLNGVLDREQVPTVPEYVAIRKAIGGEPEISGEVVADLERLRVALQTGDGSGLTEILEDLLRGMDKSSRE
jgi:lambda repressor-like predicted transcriptional regulator